MNKLLPIRMATIRSDLDVVFAGDSDYFDWAAVNVAETLVLFAEQVLEWAKTPGNHGGNPYTKEFVKTARKVVGDD